MGFAGSPFLAGVPRHVLITLIALVLAGLCGVAAGARQRRSPVSLGRFLVAGFVPAAGSAWLVAAYGNSWTVHGWTDFGRTVGLVMTLAFVPFTYGVIVAARALSRSQPGRSPGSSGLDRSPVSSPRVAAAGLLAVALGWIGYVALPYLLLWGPILVIVLVFGAVFALSGGLDSRRSAVLRRGG